MPETVTVAAVAMATRFEVALHGAPAASLRAAAEEVADELAEIERVKKVSKSIIIYYLVVISVVILKCNKVTGRATR